jgi:hypothetical protein
MKIALLVTGGIRSAACNEQIACFQRVLDALKAQGDTDTYLCLGLRNERENVMVRSAEGMNNLQTLIQIMQPKYIRFF